MIQSHPVTELMKQSVSERNASVTALSGECVVAHCEAIQLGFVRPIIGQLQQESVKSASAVRGWNSRLPQTHCRHSATTSLASPNRVDVDSADVAPVQRALHLLLCGKVGLHRAH